MYFHRSLGLIKNRKSLRTIFILIISSLIIFFFTSNPSNIYLDDPLLQVLENVEKIDFEGFNKESGLNNNNIDHLIVPNVIHLIRFNLPEFSFVDYIALRAAMRNQNPDRFYIHTDNVNPKTNDFRGYYWDLVKKDKELWNRIRVLPLEDPAILLTTDEVFGDQFNHFDRLWHINAVQSARILMKYGGIYLDNDVYIVQNLDKYRKYECTMNWESKLYISNQLIIAHKDARFLPMWLETYKKFPPNTWYRTDGGEKPTTEILRARPELVHRVEGLFGADSNVARNIYEDVNYDWTAMDAIHLQFWDRKELDRFYNETKVLDEETIKDYKYPFGEMARLVLD